MNKKKGKRKKNTRHFWPTSISTSGMHAFNTVITTDPTLPEAFFTRKTQIIKKTYISD